MAKVNITKPTGSVDALNYISAFKADGNVYIIFDSEKTGSMGLPIIYVSKYTNGKLEKIVDPNEWQSAKNYLKGIISGTNFEYIKVDGNLMADEVYYMPLTLPQASFDVIRSRYVVPETGSAADTSTQAGGNSPGIGVNGMMPNVATQEKFENVVPPTPITLENPVQASATNTVSTPLEANLNSEPELVSNPVVATPLMPDNNVGSNSVVSATPVSNLEIPTVSAPTPSSTVSTPQPEEAKAPTQMPTPAVADVAPSSTVTKDISNSLINSFDSDKETFLKACENMFDALVSKYQKQLAELDRREKEIKLKEQEIETKLHNASEHLANAEAREQVANIAHDNAQRVMDLNNFMPVNPDTTQAGVI